MADTNGHPAAPSSPDRTRSADGPVEELARHLDSGLGPRPRPAPTNKEEIARGIQLCNILAVDLGERYTPALARLDTYIVYDERQRAVLDKVREIKAGIKDYVRECRGLLFYGPPGTGKTHLLANVVYTAASAGFPCRYFRGGQIYRRFNDSFHGGQLQMDILREVCEPWVIGLSDPDPPKDDLTAFNARILKDILEGRNDRMRPTWASVNAMSLAQLEAMLSAPVVSRLCDDGILIYCDWPDYRLRLRP